MGLGRFVIVPGCTQHLPRSYRSPLCCAHSVDANHLVGGTMQSEVPSNGEVRRITLSGSCGAILAEAAASGRPILRVDLSGLTFADSSAVKALLVGAKAADAHGVAYQL